MNKKITKGVLIELLAMIWRQADKEINWACEWEMDGNRLVKEDREEIQRLMSRRDTCQEVLEAVGYFKKLKI